MMRGVLGVALVVALVSAGCASPPPLFVVANAPRLANGLSIAVAVPPGAFGATEGTASFTVRYGGQLVYPGDENGAPIQLAMGRGAAFVPYYQFVVQNGDYEVTASHEGRSEMVRVAVQKWVSYVYVLPYLRNDTLLVDVVLEQAPGSPNERIFAEGQLDMEVRYRGEGGDADEVRWRQSLRTTGFESFQRVAIPLEDLARTDRNRGFYEVHATFHNAQANGNTNVPLDPTLDDPSPPANWIYLELPDRCAAAVQLPEPLPCLDDPVRAP